MSRLPTNVLPLDGPINVESDTSESSCNGTACTRKVSSLFDGESAGLSMTTGDELNGDFDILRLSCMRDSISIFSSFSSNKSFNSLVSPSSTLTRSSSDSVYPRGNARRLSLSLVLHSNPTFAHWEQHGRIPSHRIFLLLQRSHACAILLCAVIPTLITFIGRIPGIFAVVVETTDGADSARSRGKGPHSALPLVPES